VVAPKDKHKALAGSEVGLHGCLCPNLLCFTLPVRLDVALVNIRHVDFEKRRQAEHT